MIEEMSPLKLTRRTLFRTCGVACWPGAIRRLLRGAERLQWETQPDLHGASTRTYRADAQVILLSVPLLRKSGVGAGSVTWWEDRRVRLLNFTGYSFPERAAGLNRLGFIRELSRKESDGMECIYFGLMTASPEESAAQARAALHKEVKEQLYTAIDGRVAPGDVETCTAHFTAPARLSVARQDELLAMARQALSSAPSKPPEFDAQTVTERTFLQALARLLEEPSRDHTRYVYNGRLYNLSVRRYSDVKAAAYFREKQLIAPQARVIRVEGKLRRDPEDKETSFQIWVEEAARPLPLRIEYQAKPYLRLIFEANVPAQTG